MHKRFLILVSVIALLSVNAVAREFTQIKVLPEGERARSNSDSYIYLFMEVAPMANSCSLYQVDCAQSTSTSYRSADLPTLVERVKGSCLVAAESSGSVAFLVAGSRDARLCLRIPLSAPLSQDGTLDIKLYFYQDKTIQGRFFLGTTSDFKQAVEIFVREPATSTQARVKARLTLSGDDLAKFLQGTLEPQKGILGVN